MSGGDEPVERAEAVPVGCREGLMDRRQSFAGPELRVGEWWLVPELCQLATPPTLSQGSNPNTISLRQPPIRLEIDHRLVIPEL